MTQTLVLVILAALFFSSLGGTYTLMSIGGTGYSSGFQGPKARFAGVRYDNKPYTSFSIAAPLDGGTTTGGSTQGASLASFDTVLKFDPDAYNTGTQHNRRNVFSFCT